MTFSFPWKKGSLQIKGEVFLANSSAGCSFAFLGYCQTLWNDSVERNVRFPPFIIMVTLKPNYSHLNSSLMVLLLIPAPKCTAWLGSSLLELAEWLRHYTGVCKGHGAAAGVLGLAVSAMPALVLPGGRDHHGTCCGVTSYRVILHVTPRLVLGWRTRELGHFTSKILPFRIVLKDDYT